MQCICHIINLVVQDSLQHIEPHIENIRGPIILIANSLARQQEFEAMCASFNIKQRKIKIDIKNHWN